MSQNMEDNRDIRKQYIERFAVMIYQKFSNLFPEGEDALKQDIVSRFLDTELSYDEISNRIIDIVRERRDNLDKEVEEEKLEERRKQIDSLVENIYKEYSDVLKESLPELQVEAEQNYLDTPMTIEEIKDAIMKKVNERVEEIEEAEEAEDKLDNQEEDNETKEENEEVDTTIPEREEKEENTDSYEDKENGDRKVSIGDVLVDAGIVAGVARGVAADPIDSSRREEVRAKMAGLAGPIGGVTAGIKDISGDTTTYYPRNGDAIIGGKIVPPLKDRTTPNTTTELGEMITPISDNKTDDLNAMLEDSSNSIEKSPKNTINKQFVKTPPKPSNNSGESGSIGISTIILSVLAITSFILIAMILNVLLK